MAKASHSASGGNSQALRSETCKRRGQQVSTVPPAWAQLPRELPRALRLLLGRRARQSLWQGTTQRCLCCELALAPLSKDPALQSAAHEQSANSHPGMAGLPVLQGHGCKSPHFQGYDENRVLHASLALWRAKGSLEPLCRCFQSSNNFMTLNRNLVPYGFSTTPSAAK